MYPVDLHIHTIASTHAYSTLHDYIAEARKKNIKLLAITDHGPEMVDSPHEYHFINMRVWPRIIEGIGILRGIEANIKNLAGDIDCTQIVLETMDLIIAGFHETVFPPQDQKTHTAAMIATMAQGKVHIISHPGNPHYPINIPAVATAAAHYQVALELNNSSFTHSRLGSEPYCRAIVAATRDANGWLSLGSDSHISWSLGNFDHCKRILQEEAFPDERVLNTSPKRVLQFLQNKKNVLIPEINDYFKL
ncbi:phosphatase [Candidatus Palibaumannia cicadellinicola]|uniref:Putative hydrolase YcdX n=1 Tax=Candidatus Palibaumannia cicadellinicola TaxID=186490 RepID=A0A088MY69_9GAMM|nr:phosphatase [Candidatus Baumannia cicadellinicola]AIN47237.1 Putative hydrolase YcdX [Candidatus Baumannia cicadellinicola]